MLDAKPIPEQGQEEAVTITREQVKTFDTYYKQGLRTVPVEVGQIWTESDLIKTMLLASSNNHADLLAVWAFGSVEKYLTAANEWLQENGMPDTHVADATGISEESVGTASDLGLLSVLAYDQPLISDLAGVDSITVTPGDTVYSVSQFLPEQGLAPIALSYTDVAGLTMLYRATVEVDGGTAELRGVMLAMPDWTTLEKSVKRLLKSARQNISLTTIVEKGESFARWVSAWDQQADLITTEGVSALMWKADPAVYNLYFDDPSPALAGAKVGTVLVETEDGSQELALVLSDSISDPGLGWRLLHPFEMVPALITSWQQSSAEPSESPATD